MAEKLTCCMCQKTNGKVEVLKTGTPAHPQCLEDAALGHVAKEILFRKANSDKSIRFLNLTLRQARIAGKKAAKALKNM